MQTGQLKTKEEQCCGCSACAEVCPKQAITMVESKEGFLFPQIDETLCVNCSSCLRICPLKNTEVPERLFAYGVALKDSAKANSTSGGAFAGIAKRTLENGGIVYGCAMEAGDGIPVPRHIRISAEEELCRLQGSKYVQSDTKGIFASAKTDLQSGKQVLFSGTPCQVMALKNYLHRNYSNLLTVALVCHGVPSAKMYKDYIQLASKEIKGPIHTVAFRDKTQGWGNYCMTLSSDQGTKHIPILDSSYLSNFFNGYTLRKSCFSCPFASNQRPGDITIGDFWGVEKALPEWIREDNVQISAGISCVVLTSVKGENWFQAHCEDFQYCETDFGAVANGNGRLRSPMPLKRQRAITMGIYKLLGYRGVEAYFQLRMLRLRMKKGN